VAQPLRRQLIVLNILILLPVAAVIWWAAQQTYREQIEQLEAETRSMAATIVVYLERGLDIKAVQTVIEAIALPGGTVITITDDNSIVLARSRDAQQYVGLATDSAPRRVQDVPTFAVRVGVDGVERVFANSLYAAGPWLVSVGIPTAVAYDRVSTIVERNIAITGGAVLFTLVVQFLLVRSYTSAFDGALRFSARVAAGQLEPPTLMRMPSREMEDLQRAFINMVAKLRATQEALAAQVAEERAMREELESLQRQIIRQERLAALGVLVSGVAHELNNPLQAILGFADLLTIREDLPAHVKGELALIQKESARASVIIRNLSRFTRQQTTDPSPINLSDVVASVVELLRRKLDEQHILLDVEREVVRPVMAVFAELQQVVLNFMINAEQAVAGRASPRVTVRVMARDGASRLEVEDSGPGVPPEDEPKLFQPFFTTKPVGEGTGLGLSVSYGIIQSHNGVIGYRRGDGGGALFYFELPVIAGDQTS
jgi:C4-dicarboxylate-specific signal transduction histidine kinase